jgi:hypothetical protein
LKRYKLSGIDHIPAVLIQAGGEILLSDIHNHNNPIWNIEEFSDQWKMAVIVPIYEGR